VVRFGLEEKIMPLVELCCHCDEEIDLDNDKYVIVAEANKAKGSVRMIAHAKCVQKENRGGKHGEV
jgi:hypothetical protein